MHTWDKEYLRRLLILITDETGISQRRLAELAGVHHAQVSRWKSGMHRPDYDSMLRLGSALRKEYPRMPDLTAELLAATGRPVPGGTPPSSIPADAPVCTYEQSILSDSVLRDESKAQLIRVHRAGGHANCRPLEEEAPGQKLARLPG